MRRHSRGGGNLDRYPGPSLYYICVGGGEGSRGGRTRTAAADAIASHEEHPNMLSGPREYVSIVGVVNPNFKLIEI
jgi:hypothetical protein